MIQIKVKLVSIKLKEITNINKTKLNQYSQQIYVEFIFKTRAMNLTFLLRGHHICMFFFMNVKHSKFAFSEINFMLLAMILVNFPIIKLNGNTIIQGNSYAFIDI